MASQSRSWYTSHTLPSVYDDEQKENWMHNLHNRGRRSTSTFDAVALVVSAVQVASCRATVKRKKTEEKKKKKEKRKILRYEIRQVISRLSSGGRKSGA